MCYKNYPKIVVMNSLRYLYYLQLYEIFLQEVFFLIVLIWAFEFIKLLLSGFNLLPFESPPIVRIDKQHECVTRSHCLSKFLPMTKL